MTTAPAADLPGFKIVSHAGTGGLGDVFVAIRESTGGKVAIKVLRDHTNSGDVERRIRREVAALLALKGHPGVVQIEEVITTRKGPALVMEYAAEGSLHSILQRDGHLSAAETMALGKQVALLLVDAHRLGIVHRDIKPHNILRAGFGLYKVCDFGIAALTRDPGWAEQTSAVSYRYASPEELDGAKIGPASDVYSLGVTLVQTRTGSTDGLRTGASFAFASESPLDGLLASALRHMTMADPEQRPDAVRVAHMLSAANMSTADADATVPKPRSSTSTLLSETAPDGLPAPSSTPNWWE